MIRLSRLSIYNTHSLVTNNSRSIVLLIEKKQNIYTFSYEYFHLHFLALCWANICPAFEWAIVNSVKYGGLAGVWRTSHFIRVEEIEEKKETKIWINAMTARNTTRVKRLSFELHKSRWIDFVNIKVETKHNTHIRSDSRHPPIQPKPTKKNFKFNITDSSHVNKLKLIIKTNEFLYFGHEHLVRLMYLWYRRSSRPRIKAKRFVDSDALLPRNNAR